MVSVWITGGDGFIGRHLGKHLCLDGHRVSGLGFRGRQDRSLDDISWTDWEVGEIDHKLLSALAARQGLPEVVFHLAGGGSVGASIADPWQDFRSTVLSTAAVTDWVRVNAPAARVVQVSSAAVYGAGHDGPIAEDAALSPYSPYGTHKLMSETLCTSARANFGMDTITVRPFSILGPGLRKQLLWDCCQRLSKNPEVLELGGTGNELRDWLDVGDLVRILSAAAKCDVAATPVINAGTGSAISVRAIVQMLATAWGRPDLPLAFSGQSRPGDPFSLVADTRRLKTLGVMPKVAVQTSINAYVSWFRTA